MSGEGKKLFQNDWEDLKRLWRVLVTRSAAQPIALESVPFLADGVEELVVDIAMEPSWRKAVQGRLNRKGERLVRDHLSKAPSKYCAIPSESHEKVARYDILLEAKRERRRWFLAEVEAVQYAISEGDMPEGLREHVFNHFGLELNEALVGLYMTGLDKAWFHTHLLAVWLRGGILVGWEGEFPEGRIIGHFFGKEPGPWP